MSRRTGPPFSFGSSPETPRPRPTWPRKVAIALIIVTAVGGYLYYHPSFIEPYLRGTPLQLPGRTTTIYRWRNAEGTLEHSNTPPPRGVDYDTVEISSDTNVIPLAPASK